MARVSLDPPASLRYRIARWACLRRFGVLPDPVAALAHNSRVSTAIAVFELLVQRWRTVSDELKDLAALAAAAQIGCSWCLDFGYWEARMSHGVPAAKLRAVPAWRHSDLFTEPERLVLEYAEAMTRTPPAVTDELTARLRVHFSDAQLVELTSLIALENQRSRINSALGLTAQGFADRCELARPSAGAAAGARDAGRER